MVRSKSRKPKGYTFNTMADEDYDEDNPGVITKADGTRRATRPGEVHQVLVGHELLAAQIEDPSLRDSDDSDNSTQRTSAPAHNAGLSSPTTGRGTSAAASQDPPAQNAGDQGPTQNVANPESPAHNAGSVSATAQTTTPSLSSKVRPKKKAYYNKARPQTSSSLPTPMETTSSNRSSPSV